MTILALARIIHERFCCNRGFAATTSHSAGVLATQSLTVLFKYASVPRGCAFPAVSLGDSADFRNEVS